MRHLSNFFSFWVNTLIVEKFAHSMEDREIIVARVVDLLLLLVWRGIFLSIWILLKLFGLTLALKAS